MARQDNQQGDTRKTSRRGGITFAASDEHARALGATMAALRTAATITGAFGGLACYMLLTHAGVAPVVAVIAGLVFALMGRLAMTSLGREWVLHMAARQAGAVADAARPASSNSPALQGVDSGAKQTRRPPDATRGKRR